MSADDEPTAGRERERFIAMVRNVEANEDTNEYDRYMTKTAKRITNMQVNQNKAMPKICQGMPYVGPKIVTHIPEKTGNNCVITNETHNKNTNNGFSRGDQGRFFMH